MNFIFPQNYNFDNKLFGFISYSSLILNLIWACIIFFISNCFSAEIGKLQKDGLIETSGAWFRVAASEGK
jgi:hypothetical protein